MSNHDATPEAHPIPPADQRSSYRLWAYDKLRYGDTDRQDHINNAAYATFAETGRVTFLYDPKLGLLKPGQNAVVARLEIDFKSELRYPGIVDIGLRVLAIGRSSCRLGEAIFVGEVCAATCEVVMVLVEDATRKSTPIAGKLREWLEAARA
jgi:acyl-CoA thioester hydrolase